MKQTTLITLAGLFIFNLSLAQETKTLNLIETSEHSGHVRNEFAFETFCTLNADAKVTVIDKTGINPRGGWLKIETHEYSIPPRLMNKLKTWIIDSKEGPFLSGPAYCDLGQASIRAFNDDHFFDIYTVQDCTKKVTNESKSAELIREFVKDYCHFRHL